MRLPCTVSQTDLIFWLGSLEKVVGMHISLFYKITVLHVRYKISHGFSSTNHVFFFDYFS
jgi:hypothetical protein